MLEKQTHFSTNVCLLILTVLLLSLTVVSEYSCVIILWPTKYGPVKRSILGGKRKCGTVGGETIDICQHTTEEALNKYTARHYNCAAESGSWTDRAAGHISRLGCKWETGLTLRETVTSVPLQNRTWAMSLMLQRSQERMSFLRLKCSVSSQQLLCLTVYSGLG